MRLRRSTAVLGLAISVGIIAVLGAIARETLGTPLHWSTRLLVAMIGLGLGILTVLALETVASWADRPRSSDEANLGLVAAVLFAAVGVAAIGAYTLQHTEVGRELTNTVPEEDLTPRFWRLTTTRGNVTAELTGGPVVRLGALSIERGNTTIEPCLGDTCNPGALVRVGDHVFAPCQPSGSHRTTLLVDDRPSETTRLRCARA